MTTLHCASFAEAVGLQAKGYAPARPISAASAFIQNESANKYHALLPYFVRQQTDCSCSVAATTVILNAALGWRHRPVWTQAQVVASDTSGLWERATADDPLCTGVDLPGLALFVMRSFYAAGLKNVAVDVHHVASSSQETRDTLRHQLTLSEANAGDHYVVVNFHQGTLLGVGEDVGHMSVVAAYDNRHDRVLVFDVDSRGFEPYWVELERLLAGMNTQDELSHAPRGYLVVRLNR